MLLDPIESQVNPIHTFMPCILKGHFNIILHLCQVLVRIFFRTSFLTDMLDTFLLLLVNSKC